MSEKIQCFCETELRYIGGGGGDFGQKGVLDYDSSSKEGKMGFQHDQIVDIFQKKSHF